MRRSRPTVWLIGISCCDSVERVLIQLFRQSGRRLMTPSPAGSRRSGRRYRPTRRGRSIRFSCAPPTPSSASFVP